MRVACPECTAEYDLPDALAARLGEGRTVRCARCGTTWAPAAQRPAEPPAAPVLQPEAVSAMASAGPMPPAAPMEPPAPAISSAPSVPVAPAMPREPALPAPAGPDEQDALADLFTADEPPSHHVPSPAKRRETHSASPSTPPIATALAWTASIVALLGLAVAAWHWRFDIVEAWPPAVRAFMALGLG